MLPQASEVAAVHNADMQTVLGWRPYSPMPVCLMLTGQLGKMPTPLEILVTQCVHDCTACLRPGRPPQTSHIAWCCWQHLAMQGHHTCHILGVLQGCMRHCTK